MNNAPIITLEISSMKEIIRTMLHEQVMQIDANVQQAVEDFCTDGRIKHVIDTAVTEALNAAVKEEVRNFFQWTAPGRLAVKQAVLEHLNEWEKSQSRFDKGTPC